MNHLTDPSESWWFYLTSVVAVIELILVLSNVGERPGSFLRALFGVALLGFVPGFLTTVIIFPASEVNILERLGLSIFLSVLVSITIGVLLGLGPFFQTANNIIALTAFVILAGIIACYRRYDFWRRRT